MHAIAGAQPAPPEPWFAKGEQVHTRALYLGRRLDLRSGGRRRPVTQPVTRRVGEGLAILFPFGAVVTVGLTDLEEQTLLTELRDKVVEPATDRIHDGVLVRALPGRHTEGLDEDGDCVLDELGELRLRIVADVLAKSVVLDHHEQTIGKVFEEMQPLVEKMRKSGKTARRAKDLVTRIGHALAVRQEMVWRVEVDEKPDIVWDRPDLERLWLRLSDEYDLGERHRALGRKIELLDESASSLLAVLQSNRAHHAEQAIIWLIVFEIGLTLFEMWH